MKRREFLGTVAVAAASTCRAEEILVSGLLKEPEFPICAFSKAFEWLDSDYMSGLLADAGFEGIDLTVRPRGHVEPERVEHDLPQAISAAHKHGLKVSMITTAITDAKDPLTERVLQTAAREGVKYYRTGYYTYDDRLTASQNLERFKQQLTALAGLNARHQIQGGYQNHAGARFGSPVWDLWYALKDLDARFMGCQYDFRHAVAEGLQSWPLGFKAIASHVSQFCIKDFTFAQDEKGNWRGKSVPLGTGVADYESFFSLCQKYCARGPLSIHYEFPLGDDPSLPLTERIKKVLPTVRKEVDTLHVMLNKVFPNEY